MNSFKQSKREKDKSKSIGRLANDGDKHVELPENNDGVSSECLLSRLGSVELSTKRLHKEPRALS